ncbi:hypothetical protein MLD38_018106 [Melastoma candidum]|uniref:Uncharacterized protein n=1 Tax=Melastoma candidum TaxID=119954 RepID=A0ACB9QU39_9MYRT|nr:hypothetical protein MLD38_018106 [Melastoma candidum]
MAPSIPWRSQVPVVADPSSPAFPPSATVAHASLGVPRSSQRQPPLPQPTVTNNGGPTYPLASHSLHTAPQIRAVAVAVTGAIRSGHPPAVLA